MRASKLLHRIFKFINYANLCKFIHFANLFKSDRAWCGLQNFHTELFNSLIMLIYANLFKINENATSLSSSWPNLILFGLSDRASWGLQNFYIEF